jgi:hypothetical protein
MNHYLIIIIIVIIIIIIEFVVPLGTQVVYELSPLLSISCQDP